MNVRSNYYFPSFCLREEGEDNDVLSHFYDSSGLTISENRKYIYVEASLPGIQLDEIEMVFEYGTLWIKAKRKSANRFKRKCHSQALSHFSYRVAIPADVEERPKRMRYKNGILKLVFVKKKKIFSKAPRL